MRGRRVAALAVLADGHAERLLAHLRSARRLDSLCQALADTTGQRRDGDAHGNRDENPDRHEDGHQVTDRYEDA